MKFDQFCKGDDQIGQPSSPSGLGEVHIYITFTKPFSQRRCMKLAQLVLTIRKLLVKVKLGFPAILGLDLIPKIVPNLKGLSIVESFMFSLLLHCSLAGIMDLAFGESFMERKHNVCEMQ